jgi:hypothetical protein
MPLGLLSVCYGILLCRENPELLFECLGSVSFYTCDNLGEELRMQVGLSIGPAKVVREGQLVVDALRDACDNRSCVSLFNHDRN